jgi:hypothetical protein
VIDSAYSCSFSAVVNGTPKLLRGDLRLEERRVRPVEGLRLERVIAATLEIAAADRGMACAYPSRGRLGVLVIYRAEDRPG